MSEARAAYEQALRGLVDAMHGAVVAFEATALAAKEWDPDGLQSAPDPHQHAALTSCRALMGAILARHAGAAQTLGLDALIPRSAPGSVPGGAAPASTPVGDSYVVCAAAARAAGDQGALEQLRLAINADPSLAALVALAMRRSAIPGMAVQTPDADERLPSGWAILSGIRSDSQRLLSIEVCSGECAARALVTPAVTKHLNASPGQLMPRKD